MKPFLLAALLVPLAACASAPAPAPSARIDPARLSAHVQVLASDAFEGRGPATAGEAKTVAYLIEQFTAAGAEPGGDLKDGVRAWTQDVPLGRFEIEGPVTAGFAAPQIRTRPLVQGEDVALRAAQDNSGRVAIAAAPVVFIGYGVKAPERNWDDFKGVDLRGKVALVLINDPDFETGEGDFGGKAMTYYGRWTYKYEEAARQGLAGILVVHETAPASYGWPTVKNSNTNTQFDIVRADPSAVHVPMEGWVQRDVAAAMVGAAGLDFEALKRQAQGRDFRPVDLAGVTFSADYAVKHDVIVSKNVVARLTGTARPDEVVIHSAHFDHLGVGLPDAKGDTIYNGAVDNGTGTAALLELARAYAAAPRTQRSVVFLAVTAEEKGLLGSEYYAANPLYPLEKTVAVLNTDALKPSGPARDFTVSGKAETDLLDRLVAVGTARGRTFTPDPRPQAGHFFRSDHFPFAKRGVPAISFGSGQDLLAGGRAAGEAWDRAYTAERYHQPADEWSPDWNLDGAAADVEMLQALGSGLANSTEWPDWKDGSEFKPVRDASAAARR